jgi:hypothetical protein
MWRRLKTRPGAERTDPRDPRSGRLCPEWGKYAALALLVIRDPRVKETVAALYKRAWDEQVAPRYRSGEPAPGMSRERFLRLLDAAEYLAAHIHEAPVWIIPCLEGGAPTRTSGSSILPSGPEYAPGDESARTRGDVDDAVFAIRERGRVGMWRSGVRSTMSVAAPLARSFG